MDFESVLRFVLDYFNVRSDGPSADNIRDLWRVARAAAQPPAPGPMLEQSVGYLQPAPEPLLGAGADLFDGSEDMDALRRHTTTAQRARQLWERRFTDGAWVIDVRDFLREIAEEKP